MMDTIFGARVRLALIAAILASFASIPPAVAQENAACGHLAEVASLPMTETANGLNTIPANVEGRTVNLAIATGSETSLLSEMEAYSIGLSPRSLHGTLFTIGGVAPKEAVDANLSLGNLASEWTFVLVPPSILPAGAKGALGADIMRSYDVDLDNGGHKFRLVSPAHCEGHVVYWTKDPVAVVSMTLDAKGRIAVPVTLDTVSTTAAIDTGTAESLIAAEFAREGFRSADFHALSLEGVTISNPKLALAPGMAMGPSAPPLVIGQDLLRRFHVYIAYGEKRLYLTGAGAH